MGADISRDLHTCKLCCPAFASQTRQVCSAHTSLPLTRQDFEAGPFDCLIDASSRINIIRPPLRHYVSSLTPAPAARVSIRSRSTSLFACALTLRCYISVYSLYTFTLLPCPLSETRKSPSPPDCLSPHILAPVQLPNHTRRNTMNRHTLCLRPLPLFPPSPNGTSSYTSLVRFACASARAFSRFLSRFRIERAMLAFKREP